MKVVLFKTNFWNPKQFAISLFTWSKITHAGLLFEGEDRLYDASESRGNVDFNKPIKDFKKQLVLQTLLSSPTINGRKTEVIAVDLRNKLFRKPIDSDDILVLLERACLTPTFIGKAKDYERLGN